MSSYFSIIPTLPHCELCIWKRITPSRRSPRSPRNRAWPEGLSASRIAEALKIPSSSLSFHLKELTHAGLVVPRQQGRFILYAARFDTMDALLGFLTENCCGGNPCSPLPSSCCAAGA